MIDVYKLLEAPPDHQDTPQQAAVRRAVQAALDGHSAPDTIRFATDLISVLRDQLLAGVGDVRRIAAREAIDTLGMTQKELVLASHQSRQTVARLVTESRGI